MADDEAETPTTVRVITETRNLRSPPSVAPEELCATGNAWEEWLEGIEREFRYFKETDPVDKNRCTHHLWRERRGQISEDPSRSRSR